MGGGLISRCRCIEISGEPTGMNELMIRVALGPYTRARDDDRSMPDPL